MKINTTSETNKTNRQISVGLEKNHKLKHHLWFITLRFFICAVILGVFTILPVCLPVSAEPNRHIQELHDAIEGGRGMVYTLSGLKKGDTLYAYMANTDGNLDPMLGIPNFKIRGNCFIYSENR